MMTCKSPADRHTSHRGTLKSNTRFVCAHTCVSVRVFGQCKGVSVFTACIK